MSAPAASRPVVPEGTASYLTTRQHEIKGPGFVGYETIWAEFQKEIPYETPKKP